MISQSILTALLSIILSLLITPTQTITTLDDQKPVTPPTSPIPGISLPSLGLGLWNSFNDSATHAVSTAFTTGYTHFDSAAAYSNEAFVGAGLSTTNLSRHEYWLTSKLWNTHHRPHLVRPALEQTLSDLNTTYLDLYLMHWPVAFRPDAPAGRTILDQDTSVTDTWAAMEDLVRANLTRFIGVSNFSPRQLDAVLRRVDKDGGKNAIRPFAHEFETHPYLQQRQFVEWHREQNIIVIAYSPLANLNPTYNGTHGNLPPITDDDFWIGLAAKHNVSAPQAVLAWGRQRGTTVIPKSVHAKYIQQNFRSGSEDVVFTEEEMLRIVDEDKKARFNNPSKAWGVELFEGLDGGGNRFLTEDVPELR